MGFIKALLAPQAFCPICVRYMTVAEAKAHNKHARVIRWPKKK